MKILLVEDEIGIVNFLKKYLESENFIVDIALEGISASFLAETNEYNIIILDRMLPNKDGKSICSEIRASGKTTPIVILSVLDDPNEKTELLKCGADSYIEKPFKPDDLLATIQKLLNTPVLK